MSIESSYDVSVDYNVLVSSIGSIKSIKDKCSNLVSALSSVDVSILDSAGLMTESISIVENVIDGPIQTVLSRVSEVESLFYMFQNEEFYTQYLNSNGEFDMERMITDILSNVETQESCFTMVEKYDLVLAMYNVQLRELQEQIDFYERQESLGFLSSVDFLVSKRDINLSEDSKKKLEELEAQYSSIYQATSLVNTLRNYAMDAAFFMYGANDDFSALSGVPTKIARYELKNLTDFNFYDSAGNLIEVSDAEAAVYFANIGKNYSFGDLGDLGNTYNYLTADEKKVANYLINTGNVQKLEQYFAFKEDYANMRHGEELAKEVTSKIDSYYVGADTAAERSLAYTRTLSLLAADGFSDGLFNFVDGISNLFTADGVVSAEQYKTSFLVDYLSNRYDESQWSEIIATGTYEISTSLGNMAPSMALGFLTGCPLFGSASMGLSAVGSSREQGLQSGMNEVQAWIYGTLSGASEMTLEYFIGGIPGLSKLDEVAKLPGFKGFLAKMGGEALEESTQSLAEPLFNTMVTGQKYEVDMKEVLKSGIYGAITAGVTNGGQLIIGKTVYSMKNMDNKFLADLAMKYEAEDLTDSIVQDRLRNDLSRYEVRSDNSTITVSNDSSYEVVETVKNNTNTKNPNLSLRPNANPQINTSTDTNVGSESILTTNTNTGNLDSTTSNILVGETSYEVLGDSSSSNDRSTLSFSSSVASSAMPSSNGILSTLFSGNNETLSYVASSNNGGGSISNDSSTSSLEMPILSDIPTSTMTNTTTASSNTIVNTSSNTSNTDTASKLYSDEKIVITDDSHAVYERRSFENEREVSQDRLLQEVSDYVEIEDGASFEESKIESTERFISRTVGKDILKDFYQQMPNALDNPKVIQKLIDIYVETTWGGGRIFYNSLVSSANPARVSTDINVDMSNMYHSKMFNEWKSSFIHNYESGLIDKSSGNSKLYEFLKNHADVSTMDEIYDVYSAVRKDSDLYKAFDKKRWNSLDNEWVHVDSKYTNAENGKRTQPKHRLYLAVDRCDVHEMATYLVDKFNQYKLPFYFKFSELSDVRDDRIVLYADSKQLPSYLEVLREIKAEHPEFVSKFANPPLLTGNIDGWIGYGSELSKTTAENLPGDIPNSYNMIRANLLFDSIDKVTNKYILDNLTTKGKVSGKTMQQVLTERYVKEKISSLTKDYNNSVEYRKKKDGSSFDENSIISMKGYSLADINSLEFRKALTNAVYSNLPSLMQSRYDGTFIKDVKFTFNNKTFYVDSFTLRDVVHKFAGSIKNPVYIENIKAEIKNSSSKYGSIDPKNICFNAETVRDMKSVNREINAIFETFNFIINDLKDGTISVQSKEYINKLDGENLIKLYEFSKTSGLSFERFGSIISAVSDSNLSALNDYLATTSDISKFREMLSDAQRSSLPSRAKTSDNVVLRVEQTNTAKTVVSASEIVSLMESDLSDSNSISRRTKEFIRDSDITMISQLLEMTLDNDLLFNEVVNSITQYKLPEVFKNSLGTNYLSKFVSSLDIMRVHDIAVSYYNVPDMYSSFVLELVKNDFATTGKLSGRIREFMRDAKTESMVKLVETAIEADVDSNVMSSIINAIRKDDLSYVDSMLDPEIRSKFMDSLKISLVDVLTNEVNNKLEIVDDAVSFDTSTGVDSILKSIVESNFSSEYINSLEFDVLAGVIEMSINSDDSLLIRSIVKNLSKENLEGVYKYLLDSSSIKVFNSYLSEKQIRIFAKNYYHNPKLLNKFISNLNSVSVSKLFNYFISSHTENNVKYANSFLSKLDNSVLQKLINNGSLNEYLSELSASEIEGSVLDDYAFQIADHGSLEVTGKSFTLLSDTQRETLKKVIFAVKYDYAKEGTLSVKTKDLISSLDSKTAIVFIDKAFNSKKHTNLPQDAISIINPKEIPWIVYQNINKSYFSDMVSYLTDSQIKSIITTHVSTPGVLNSFFSNLSSKQLESVVSGLDTSNKYDNYILDTINSYVNASEICSIRKMIDNNTLGDYVDSLSDEELGVKIDSILSQNLKDVIDIADVLINVDSDRVYEDMVIDGTIKYNEKLPDDLKYEILSAITNSCDNQFMRFVAKDGTYGIDQGEVRRHAYYVVKNSFINDINSFAEFIAIEKKMSLEKALELANALSQENMMLDTDDYELISNYISLSDSYTPMEATKLLRDNFIRREDRIYKGIVNKLVKMGTERDVATMILDSIDTTGVCSYASVANMIFNTYMNNPKQFQKEFGFKLYSIVNGKQEINSLELLADMYIYINSNLCGGSLFNITDGKITLNSEKIDTSKQIRISNSSGIKYDLVNKYLKIKDSSLVFETKSLSSARDINVSKYTTDNIRNVIARAMQEGKQVSLGLYQSNKEFRFLENGEVRQSSLKWNEGNGHAVFVTGLTKDGVIVSTWGERRTISFDDFIDNKFTINISSFTESSVNSLVVESDTVNDGIQGFVRSRTNKGTIISGLDISDMSTFDEIIVDGVSNKVGFASKFKNMFSSSKNSLPKKETLSVSDLSGNSITIELDSSNYSNIMMSLELGVYKYDFDQSTPVSFMEYVVNNSSDCNLVVKAISSMPNNLLTDSLMETVMYKCDNSVNYDCSLLPDKVITYVLENARRPGMLTRILQTNKNIKLSDEIMKRILPIYENMVAFPLNMPESFIEYALKNSTDRQLLINMVTPECPSYLLTDDVMFKIMHYNINGFMGPLKLHPQFINYVLSNSYNREFLKDVISRYKLADKIRYDEVRNIYYVDEFTSGNSISYSDIDDLISRIILKENNGSQSSKEVSIPSIDEAIKLASIAHENELDYLRRMIDDDYEKSMRNLRSVDSSSRFDFSMDFAPARKGILGIAKDSIIERKLATYDSKTIDKMIVSGQLDEYIKSLSIIEINEGPLGRFAYQIANKFDLDARGDSFVLLTTEQRRNLSYFMKSVDDGLALNIAFTQDSLDIMMSMDSNAIVAAIDKLSSNDKYTDTLNYALKHINRSTLPSVVETIMVRSDSASIISQLSNKQLIELLKIYSENYEVLDKLYRSLSSNRLANLAKILNDLSYRGSTNASNMYYQLVENIDFDLIRDIKGKIDNNTLSSYLSNLSDTEAGEFIEKVIYQKCSDVESITETIFESLGAERISKMILNASLKYDVNFSSEVQNAMLEMINAQKDGKFRDLNIYGVDQGDVRKHVNFVVKYSWTDDIASLAKFLSVEQGYDLFEAERIALEMTSPNYSMDADDYQLVTKYLEKHYGVRDAMRILRESFTRKTDARYNAVLTKLMEKGTSKDTATKILDCIDTTGVCSYASVANLIVDVYKNTPNKFRRDFGFDLYKEVNGHLEINSTELLADMYIYINSNVAGGSLFTINNGRVNLNTTILNTDKQFFLSGQFGFRTDLINKYLRSKNEMLSLRVASTYEFSSSMEGSEVDNLKTAIVRAMQEGKQISLGVYRTKNKEFRFMDARGKVMESTSTWSEGDGHAVYVTGVTNNGVVVSTWGKRRVIPFTDFVGNKYRLNFIEFNTSGKKFSNRPMKIYSNPEFVKNSSNLRSTGDMVSNTNNSSQYDTILENFINELGEDVSSKKLGLYARKGILTDVPVSLKEQIQGVPNDYILEYLQKRKALMKLHNQYNGILDSFVSELGADVASKKLGLYARKGILTDVSVSLKEQIQSVPSDYIIEYLQKRKTQAKTESIGVSDYLSTLDKLVEEVGIDNAKVLLGTYLGKGNIENVPKAYRKVINKIPKNILENYLTSKFDLNIEPIAFVNNDGNRLSFIDGFIKFNNGLESSATQMSKYFGDAGVAVNEMLQNSMTAAEILEALEKGNLSVIYGVNMSNETILKVLNVAKSFSNLKDGNLRGEIALKLGIDISDIDPLLIEKLTLLNDTEIESILSGAEFNKFKQFLSNTRQGKWINDLEFDEIKLLKFYSSVIAKRINGELRKVKGMYFKIRKSLFEEYNGIDICETMDKAIERFGGLDNDMILYRAVGIESIFNHSPELAELYEGLKKLGKEEDFKFVFGSLQSCIGKKIGDYGYMSTSPGYNYSFASHENKYPIVLQIMAPKGTKGAYINQISQYYNKEYEFLLARDTKMIIEDVSFCMDVNNRTKIFVKVKVVN